MKKIFCALVLASQLAISVPVLAAPVRASTVGDRGAMAAMLALGTELMTLGQPDHWRVESMSNDARTVELARTATMRRILAGIEGELQKQGRREELNLSPEIRGAVRQVATRVRIAAVNARYSGPEQLALMLLQLASDIRSRFEPADISSPSESKLSKLMPGRHRANVAEYDAAAEGFGRVLEQAATTLTILTVPEADPELELNHFLHEAAMPALGAGEIPAAKTFWAGVDSMLNELGFVIQDMGTQLRPHFTDSHLPAGILRGIQQTWRVLRETPPRLPSMDATRWFLGREKLRSFGRPAKCERVLTAEKLSKMQLELDAPKALPGAPEESGEIPIEIEIDGSSTEYQIEHEAPRRFPEGVKSQGELDGVAQALDREFIL